MYAQIINVTNGNYSTAQKALKNHVVQGETINGFFVTPGTGANGKFWFVLADVALNPTTINALVDPYLREGYQNGGYVSPEMEKLAGKIITVRPCGGVYQFESGAWSWMASWLHLNIDQKPATPTAPPAPVFRMPLLSNMKARLAELHKKEYETYAFSKTGIFVGKPTQLWSFRSTARTMLKKRIEAISTISELRTLIADIYGNQKGKDGPLSLEDWVTKFYN